MTNPSFVQLIGGIDQNGKIRAIAVNPDGSLKTSTDSGGGTTGRKIAFTKTSVDYTLTLNDDFLAVDAGNGNVNIALPTAESAVNSSGNTIYEVKKIDTTSNLVTVIPQNSETIDGSANFVLNYSHEAINLISDGENWFIF